MSAFEITLHTSRGKEMHEISTSSENVSKTVRAPKKESRFWLSDKGRSSDVYLDEGYGSDGIDEEASIDGKDIRKLAIEGSGSTRSRCF